MPTSRGETPGRSTTMSEVKIRLESRDGYHELVDALEDEFPDRLVAIGQSPGLGLAITLDESSNTKRVADFIYPAEIFTEPGATTDLGNGDFRLLGASLTPAKHVDQSTDGVLDYDDFREEIDAAADALDGDAAFLVGGFSPDGNWQMYGNADNDKPRKLSSIQYPERYFETDGTAALREIHSGLFGTVVLSQSLFTDESLAFMRGERDRLPLNERDTGPSPDELREQLRSLSPGDEVLVNDRKRPLTVLAPDEAKRRGYASGEAVFLSGNGTEYRVHIHADVYPRLEWSTDREAIGQLDVVTTTPGAEGAEA